MASRTKEHKVRPKDKPKSPPTRAGRKATKVPDTLKVNGVASPRKPRPNAEGQENGPESDAQRLAQHSPCPDSLATLDNQAPTWRQRLWLNAFLGEAKGNATAAARIAGYADPEWAGWHIQQNPTIKAEMARHLADAGMLGDELIARLSEYSSGPPASLFDPETGEPSLKRIFDAGMTHWIQEVIPAKDGRWTIRFPQILAAQKILAQCRGLIKEQHNHFHLPNDLSLYSDSQIAMMRRGEDPGPPALQGQPKTVGAEATVSGQLEPPRADSTIIETTGGEASGDGSKGAGAGEPEGV
jgi:hypothetical protein